MIGRLLFFHFCFFLSLVGGLVNLVVGVYLYLEGQPITGSVVFTLGNIIIAALAAIRASDAYYQMKLHHFTEFAVKVEDLTAISKNESLSDKDKAKAVRRLISKDISQRELAIRSSKLL